MHAIAATEIFAVWEEIIISKGGDKVNLAEASCPRSTVLPGRVFYRNKHEVINSHAHVLCICSGAATMFHWKKSETVK